MNGKFPGYLLEMRMSEKTLTQLLEEYATGPEADSRTRNRIAFTQHKNEIMDALDSGWSMRKIWNVLKKDGRIGFSYSVFVHYVNQHRTTANATQHAGKEKA